MRPLEAMGKFKQKTKKNDNINIKERKNNDN
jgi:hypothetical protein